MSEVQDIRESVQRMEVHAERIKTLVEYHMDDKTIHHVPPCIASERLNNRVWGAMVAALGAMVASAWAALK